MERGAHFFEKGLLLIPAFVEIAGRFRQVVVGVYPGNTIVQIAGGNSLSHVFDLLQHLPVPADRVHANKCQGAPGNNEYSYQNYDGESEPVAVAVNYYLKKNVENDVKITIFKGVRKINELKTKKDRGIHYTLWDMTVRRERSEDEIAEIEKQQEDYPEWRRLSGNRLKYETTPALPGEYTVVLSVGEKIFKKKAVIMQDYWFDK